MIIGRTDSYSYNRLMRDKPIIEIKGIEQNNTLKLKNIFEKLIKDEVKTNKIQYIENKEKNLNTFKNDIYNKNIYFIYSSPHARKLKVIDNHNDLKISPENSLFINVDNILESNPDYSIYKITDFIIKVPNKNKNLVSDDTRFPHNIELKNGKKILIATYGDYKSVKIKD